MLRGMEWLNYHHLLYFWVVAREGSIARACEQLQLAQPTISTQLRKLEESLGKELFHRVGRGLVLTETGQYVFQYADQIFALGQELMAGVQSRPARLPLRLVVGVLDVVPKLIVYRLLEPAFGLPEPIQVICHEGKAAELLAELAIHRLDVVLSDGPVFPTVKVKAFSHRLGDCGVSVLGVPRLAARYRRRFPMALDEAPFLLPTANTALRRSLDRWFDAQGLHPRMVGEFQDSALLKEFGRAGVGLFAFPTAIEDEVQRQYGVRVVGRIETVRAQYYAITVARQLKHPALLAVPETGHSDLFA